MILVVDCSAVRLVYRAHDLTGIPRFHRKRYVAGTVAFVGNVVEFHNAI